MHRVDSCETKDPDSESLDLTPYPTMGEDKKEKTGLGSLGVLLPGMPQQLFRHFCYVTADLSVSGLLS